MSQPQSLRTLRLEKGWSQEQLATISGLSERTIQRAERGDTPSLDTLGALAASFDLSSAQLRDLITAPEEHNDMAANDTNPVKSPLFTPVVTRLLIGGAAYIAALTWLGLMQAFAGWDPELLGFAALVGGGLLASFAYFQLSGED